MKPFPLAHATHPDWRMAAALVLAQLRAQAGVLPRLALIYITDHFATHAQAMLDHLMAGLPEVTDWVGATGVGIAATGVEYVDEPALAVMLIDLPPEQYRVFNGVLPLPAAWAAPGKGDRFAAHTALVHADANTPDFTELLSELAERTLSGGVFGGLVASRSTPVQFAHSSRGSQLGRGMGAGVFSGGMSGVAFGPGVELLTVVTQGCSPIGVSRQASRTQGNLVLALDGHGALDALLGDAGVSLDQPEQAIRRLRDVLVAISPADRRPDAWPVLIEDKAGKGLGAQARVRHIIGLDPLRRGVAVADVVEDGERLVFCERHADAAREDLMHMCVALRDRVESHDPPGKRLCGAVYVSCNGRGGAHFGSPGAELQWVRRALGDVPLVGLFAGGEIAGRQLYGYTGVLTVFVSDVTNGG